MKVLKLARKDLGTQVVIQITYTYGFLDSGLARRDAIFQELIKSWIWADDGMSVNMNTLLNKFVVSNVDEYILNKI